MTKYPSSHFCTGAKYLKSRCNSRWSFLRKIACSGFTPKTYVIGLAGLGLILRKQ